MTTFVRYIDLDGTVNTRDLGGWARQAGGTTPFGRILRSDMPRTVSDEDRARLTTAGVHHVFDLRSQEEQRAEPNPLLGDAAFEVVGYDLMAPVMTARASGRGRTEDPFDLAGFYLDMTVEARDLLLDLLAHMQAARASGGLLIHCSAGKDRTGVVSALALHASGVSEADVAHEYALTHARLTPLYDHLLQGVLASGVPEAAAHRLLTAEAGTMARFLAGVEDDVIAAAEGLLDP